MASTDEEQMFITCEVCELPFTSAKSLEQHIKGRKHKKQVEDQNRQKQGGSPDGDSCIEEMKDSNTQDYACSECEVTFSGSIPYTQHLKSKQHPKVLRRKKAEDETALPEAAGSDSELQENEDADLKELVKKISPQSYSSCSLCEKQFSGPESYSQHLNSKSHAKRKSELQLLKKIKVILSMCEDSETEETCGNTGKQKGSADTEVPEKLKCKHCQKDFGSVVSFAQHLASKTHEKRKSRNKLLNDLKAIKMELEDDSSSSSEEEESSEVLTCNVCSVAFSGPENMKAHIESKKHQKALKQMKNLAKKEKSAEDGNRAEVNLEEKATVEKLITQKETDSGSG